MSSFGGSEILVVLVLALLLLGPKKLPEVGEMLGKTLRKFRQASREIRSEIDLMGDIEDRRQKSKPESQESKTVHQPQDQPPGG